MRMYNDNSDDFQKMYVDGYRKVYNAIIDAESIAIVKNINNIHKNGTSEGNPIP